MTIKFIRSLPLIAALAFTILCFTSIWTSASSSLSEKFGMSAAFALVSAVVLGFGFYVALLADVDQP